MTSEKADSLRELPAFMLAWPGCRDALLECLTRKLIAIGKLPAATQPTGQQMLAGLISELESLDAPKPLITRPTMKPLINP